MVKSTVPTYKFHKIRINTQLLGGDISVLPLPLNRRKILYIGGSFHSGVISKPTYNVNIISWIPAKEDSSKDLSN